MAEQILRTCHSFVIYARDFSSALCDREGNTVMQGSQDIAVHVGTLHFKAKAVIEAFGDDIHPGDVFAINDPYLGGTHFNDVSIIRPIFHDGEVIAYAQSNGHWADVGGSVPGSFDITAREHFGEGTADPARADLAAGPLPRRRRPADPVQHARARGHRGRPARPGRGHARVPSARSCASSRSTGDDTILTAFAEVQDYVERLTRTRVAELPDGVWETEDYIDSDPSREEGLVPVKVKLEIEGDQIRYDLSGSHPAVGTFLNAGFGSAFSASSRGTKTFFPDVPLNSGFYRAVDDRPGPGGHRRQRAVARSRSPASARARTRRS